jgi:hypothetical protein
MRAAALLTFAAMASWSLRVSAQPAQSVDTRTPETPSISGAEEVSVRGVRRSHDTVSTTVQAREAQELAGTEGDPVKVVQDLPGMARPAFGTGDLIVWGSSPHDTRTYVDGVEIPVLFHGAALRSTVNANLVQDVTLSPGAYGVDYGRGLGGVVRVETRDLPASAANGYVDVDTIDGSALVSTSIGDRLRVAAAGRYGWLDRLLPVVSAENVDPYFAVPRYGDYQGKIELDLREGERLDAVFLGSRDDLSTTIPDADPSRQRSETTGTQYQRLYLRYRRELDDGSSVEVTPWVGHDASTLDAEFGATPASLDTSTWRSGLRAMHRSRPAHRLALSLGVEVDDSQADIARGGSLEIPPREGDITVFGRPPGPDVNVDHWTAGILDLAPHAQLDLDLGPVVVSPGLRADAVLTTVSRQSPKVGSTPAVGLSHLDGVIEPRVALRWSMTPRIALFGAAGVYSQPPDPGDLSSVFGNPTLGSSNAEHVALGESLRLTDTLRADVTGFAKWMGDLPIRSSLSTPKLAQALLPTGIGRSYGAQILVRQEPWHGLFGWVSYTISRSERTTLAGTWRLFDYDQPHLLTLVVSQRLGAWTLGARLRIASGLPRTPVIGAFYDAAGDQYDPLFGPQNSMRLPTFWQLDARVDRRFEVGRVAVDAYLEALNVTDHTNGEEYIYNLDYTQRATITGLPVVAVAGVRVDL